MQVCQLYVSICSFYQTALESYKSFHAEEENKTSERGRMPSPKISTHTPSKGLAKYEPPNTTSNDHQHLHYIEGLIKHGE